MTRRLKRWLILIAGWGLVVLGFAGLFLPFLQGVLFLLLGLSVLSTEYVWAHRLLQKLKDRFPALTNRVNTARAKVRVWLRRISQPKSDKAQD